MNIAQEIADIRSSGDSVEERRAALVKLGIEAMDRDRKAEFELVLFEIDQLLPVAMHDAFAAFPDVFQEMYDDRIGVLRFIEKRRDRCFDVTGPDKFADAFLMLVRESIEEVWFDGEDEHLEKAKEILASVTRTNRRASGRAAYEFVMAVPFVNEDPLTIMRAEQPFFDPKRPLDLPATSFRR